MSDDMLECEKELFRSLNPETDWEHNPTGIALSELLNLFQCCNFAFDNHSSRTKLAIKTIELFRDQLSQFSRTARDIGNIVTEKNAAYGDSVATSADFLKLLYPDGVTPEQYGNMLLLVRIFDKQKRIATDKDAFGENPYKDIAGYAILGVSQKVEKK